MADDDDINQSSEYVIHEGDSGGINDYEAESNNPYNATTTESSEGHATQGYLTMDPTSWSDFAYYLILAGTSLFFTIQAGSVAFFGASTPLQTWLFACGMISLILCIAFVIIAKLAQNIATKARPIISGFLCLWWLAGVISATFVTSSVFQNIGNGFIFSWLSFFVAEHMFMGSLKAAVPALQGAQDAMTSHKQISTLIFLGIASLVFLVSSGTSISVSGGLAIWGLVGGIISFIVVLIGLIMSKAAQNTFGPYVSYASICLCVLWVVLFISTTVPVGGPFSEITGNGYFSSVFGMFLSFYLFTTGSLYESMTNGKSNAEYQEDSDHYGAQTGENFNGEQHYADTYGDL